MNAKPFHYGQGIIQGSYPRKGYAVETLFSTLETGLQGQAGEANDDADLSEEKASMQDCVGWATNLFDPSRIGLPCACLATRITGEPY